MKKHKLPSAPNSITLFVPFRPPSRNRSDGRLRLIMLDKAAARAAWVAGSLSTADEARIAALIKKAVR